jgi:hypothetical protein
LSETSSAPEAVQPLRKKHKKQTITSLRNMFVGKTKKSCLLPDTQFDNDDETAVRVLFKRLKRRDVKKMN